MGKWQREKAHRDLCVDKILRNACMVLKQLLQKMARRSCWLDQDEEPTEEAMQRGVEQSISYLLFLSAGGLGRRFVQSEVRWALDARKPIGLLHESDPARGGGPLKQILDEAPEEPEGIFSRSVKSIREATVPLCQWCCDMSGIQQRANPKFK